VIRIAQSGYPLSLDQHSLPQRLAHLLEVSFCSYYCAIVLPSLHRYKK
jgi:hypothetical protein